MVKEQEEGKLVEGKMVEGKRWKIQNEKNTGKQY
jgi:hypothetical protein